jgi:hypothetical protein
MVFSRFLATTTFVPAEKSQHSEFPGLVPGGRVLRSVSKYQDYSPAKIINQLTCSEKAVSMWFFKGKI